MPDKLYKAQPPAFCCYLHTKHFCFPSQAESPQTALASKGSAKTPASRPPPAAGLVWAAAHARVSAGLTCRSNIMAGKASTCYQSDPSPQPVSGSGFPLYRCEPLPSTWKSRFSQGLPWQCKQQVSRWLQVPLGEKMHGLPVKCMSTGCLDRRTVPESWP